MFRLFRLSFARNWWYPLCEIVLVMMCDGIVRISDRIYDHVGG